MGRSKSKKMNPLSGTMPILFASSAILVVSLIGIPAASFLASAEEATAEATLDFQSVENIEMLNQEDPPATLVNWKGYFHTVDEALRDTFSSEDYPDAAVSPFTQGDGIIAALSDIAFSPTDTENSSQDLVELSATISLLKTHMLNPQFIKSMPENIQPVMTKFISQISSAEKHLETVKGLISENGDYETIVPPVAKSPPTFDLSTPTSSTRRVLTGDENSTAKEDFQTSRVRMTADYIMRTRSKTGGVNGIGATMFNGGLHGSQQGHSPARAAREDGTATRRLNSDDDNVINEMICVDPDETEHKIDQCYRLANCAKNYNLYDLFVFHFGDDIDFDTGEAVGAEIVFSIDELNMKSKVRAIISHPSYHYVHLYIQQILHSN